MRRGIGKKYLCNCKYKGSYRPIIFNGEGKGFAVDRALKGRMSGSRPSTAGFVKVSIRDEFCQITEDTTNVPAPCMNEKYNNVPVIYIII